VRRYDDESALIDFFVDDKKEGDNSKDPDTDPNGEKYLKVTLLFCGTNDYSLTISQ
jgi:hypothetical protein